MELGLGRNGETNAGENIDFSLMILPLSPDLPLAVQTVPDFLNRMVHSSKRSALGWKGAVAETGPLGTHKQPDF